VHFTFHILRRTAGGRRLGNIAEGPHSFRIKQRRRRRRRRRRWSDARATQRPQNTLCPRRNISLSLHIISTTPRHIPITINHPPTLGQYVASRWTSSKGIHKRHATTLWVHLYVIVRKKRGPMVYDKILHFLFERYVYPGVMFKNKNYNKLIMCVLLSKHSLDSCTAQLVLHFLMNL
jgi:hypothetical protein